MTPFGSLGIDSLMSLEVRNRLDSSLGLKLPATLLFTFTNVALLAEHLLDAIQLDKSDDDVTLPPPTETVATANDAIAIVGMSCRFPGGGEDPEAFFQSLRNGIDAVVEIPKERWPETAVRADSPGVRYAGLLRGVEDFDAAFFGISPREAQSLDPQQRLLLEVSWEALEHAGLRADHLVGSQTSVYVGITALDYQRLLSEGHPSARDLYQVTGNMIATAAGRLSFALGLQGPAVALDTACSSSLVAVHLACQSLRRNESKLALACGVNLILSPTSMEMAAELQALSPDGRCKTFDALANGFVRGEGCGVIVLKRLDDAHRDGDTILAIIRGSAVNQDGRSTGLTTPNVLAQQALLRQAFSDAKISPSEIGYIETHGTGTPLGDPIECEALRSVIGGARADGTACVLGAVKTNVGHLESAAGMASLIKAVQALRHEVIPGNRHFRVLNPRISFDGTPFVLPTEDVAFIRNDKRRIVGVSGFGISGTNAHVVLEEAPVVPPVPNVPERSAEILVLSAKSRAALLAAAGRLSEHLSSRPELGLGDVAFSLATTRTHLEHRLALTATSRLAACNALKRAASGQIPPGTVQGKGPTLLGKVAFLFTGQGAQQVGMGQRLYEAFEVFRESFDRCASLFDEALGRKLVRVMWAESNSLEGKLLDETEYTQPSLFALEYALSELWRSWGIEPDLVAGHSIGEIVASCVAGIFSLEDAVKLVVARSRLMQALPAGGAMVSIAATEAEVAAVVLAMNDTVSIASVNGPNQVVISGDEVSVAQVAATFSARGIPTKSLRVSHAFHSPRMEPMLAEFARVAESITYRTPVRAIVSNLSGNFATEEMCSPNYWVRHVRGTVRFADSVNALNEAGTGVFIELGPQAILLGLVTSCLPDSSSAQLASMRYRKDETACILDALGQLWSLGEKVNWGNVFPTGRSRVPLPTYVWQRQRYWVEKQNPVVESSFREVIDQLIADGTLSDAAQAAVPELLAAVSARSTNKPSIMSWFHTVVWRKMTIPAKAAEDSGRWIVLADDERERAIVLDAVAKAGGVCVGVSSIDALSVVLSQESGVRTRGVLVIISPDALAEQALALPVLQQLAKLPSGGPRAYLVTRGAVSISTSEPTVNPEPAILWGLGRSFALEHPRAWGGLVDFSSGPLAREDAELIAGLLANSELSEDQIAVRLGQVFVPRIVPERPTVMGRRFKTSGTVLVTGGLGGVGLHVASWLARQEVRHLLLVGRRGLASPGVAKAVAELEALGASVRVGAADIADASAMRKLLQELPEDAPVTAVFHVAGISDTTPFAELTPERFAEVLRPKRDGIRVLEELTKGQTLDAFVCFSSISGVWGAGRLTAYGAANAFLDAWAQSARHQGRRAISISWGPWDGEGMASGTATRAELARRGLRVLAPSQSLEAMSIAMTGNDPHVVVADVEWSSFREGFEAWGVRPMLAEIAEAVGTDPGDPEIPGGFQWVAQLAALQPLEREAQMREWLGKECAAVLGHPPDTQLDQHTGFFDLGMDSLMTVQLKKRLEQALGVRISTTVTFDHPNIETLAAKLLVDVGLSPQSAMILPTTNDHEAERVSFSGTDDDALQLIAEKYEALS
jgi:epothilone polyketide synthase D